MSSHLDWNGTHRITAQKIAKFNMGLFLFISLCVVGLVLFDWFTYQFGKIDLGATKTVEFVFIKLFKDRESINTPEKFNTYKTWFIVAAAVIVITVLAVVPVWFYSSFSAAVNDYEYHHALKFLAIASILFGNIFLFIAGLCFTNHIDKDRYLIGKLDHRLFK
ncbi:MAG: hypothetical protein LBV22_03710 [Mycoplasmataceae bacterium]|jgi:hypothetical protein|nr:hypothetical protein [Mycoplasmataceae bacterium]